ncbi:YcfA-like protein [Bacteroidales bacterium Barb7]|nr:YcfA-like protein [Bacteroidales bacterium Barb7]
MSLIITVRKSIILIQLRCVPYLIIFVTSTITVIFAPPINQYVLTVKIWKRKEIIRLIEADGWYFVRQKGSHMHFHHPVKEGTTTVPGSKNKNLAPNTAKSILKQAGIKSPA